jgi:DNA polymerase III epsilon subunit-like protein
MGFIVMGMQRVNIKLSSNEIYCSCKLARFTHNESPNHKLVTLVQELGIPLVNHHRALDDAFASLKVFLSSLLRVNSAPTLKHHGHLFSLNEFEKLKSEELPAHLSQLEKFVQEAAVIEIMYSGGNYKNIFRPVKLVSLLNTPEGNILYARCLLSNLHKSFKLNKIINLRTPSAEDIQKWLKKE